MITYEEHTAILTEALEKIEMVMGELDVSRDTCDCCGLTVYADREQWQAYQALGSCSTRLRKTLGLQEVKP